MRKMETEEEKKIRQLEQRRASRRRYDQSDKAKALKKTQKYKDKAKEWVKKNPEKVKSSSKKSYQKKMADPEKKKRVLERNKQWRQSNPEKQRASQAVCDARRRLKWINHTVELTAEERKKVLEFYRNCPPGYEVDHIIPINRGGKHTADNLQYLTPEENFQKFDNWLGIQDGEAYDPNYLIRESEEEKVDRELEEFNNKIPKWKKLEERKRLLEAAEEALRQAEELKIG